jgi:hypothetical protein
MKKKILIISLSDLAREPRVLRQIDALIQDYNIITVGTRNSGVPNVEFIKYHHTQDSSRYTFHLNYPFFIKKFISLLIRCFIEVRLTSNSSFKEFNKRISKPIFELCRNVNPDIVIVHGLNLIPVGFQIAGRSGKVVFDAHEYYPLEFEDSSEWLKNTKPYYDFLCKVYLPKVGLMYNVCNGIANKYKEEFNVKSVVITNAAEFKMLRPLKCSGKIKLVHHGISIPSRKIELMIEMMDHVDERFELYLMLVDLDSLYTAKIIKYGSERANIKFIDPVPTSQIADFINQFDLGVVLVPPVNFNYKFGLGNKFFEFIQARIGLAIGPLPEMAAYVNSFELGVISENFEGRSLAKELNNLSYKDIETFKENAHRNALELSSEQNKMLIKNSISELVKFGN